MVSKKIYIAAVLLATILLSMPVRAQSYPGGNGDITYIKQGTLWQASADGSYRRAIDHGVRSMAWSPDGTRLAYVTGNATCGAGVWMLQDGTKRKVKIARGGCIVGRLSWSPNGTQIAFTRAKGSDRAIMRLALSEGFERAITPWEPSVAYQNPSWSPDSSQIIYERHDSIRSSLVIMTIKGGHSRELTELSDHWIAALPSWSLNGKKIVYQDSQNESYTIWPDGTHRSVISDGDSYQAAWSPSGNRLVFMEDFSRSTISIVDVDGSVIQLELPDVGQTGARQPIWSPNEKKILLIIEKVKDPQLVAFDIQNLAVSILASNVESAEWQAVISGL